jgi:hypothetical protein
MWRYVQSTGELYEPTGTLHSRGYSGRGTAKNDPAKQCVVDQGPIPRGDYTIKGAIDHPQLGPVSMPLSPDAANNMCGRSAFYIHGDSSSHPGQASDGCVIMSPRHVREAIDESADKALRVIDALAVHAVQLKRVTQKGNATSRAVIASKSTTGSKTRRKPLKAGVSRSLKSQSQKHKSAPPSRKRKKGTKARNKSRKRSSRSRKRNT